MPRAKSAPSSAIDSDVLAERLRAALPSKGLTEQRMFGGICFMLKGNMVAGASKQGFLFRVGKEEHGNAVKRPGARAMEMGGRTMQGFVFVEPARLGDAALQDWLRLALDFVGTLPAKGSKPPPKKSKVGRA